MGKIQLTRVDDRLIHGQVMTKWSKGMGINAIFIVDDEIAKDDFMKQIFISTGTHSDVSVKVLSIDETVEYWKTKSFEEFNVILLFKTFKAVYETITKGVAIDAVNIGGLSKKNDTKMIISSVYISKDDADLMREINAEYNTEIFFQMVPDSSKVSLADALKQF